MKPQPIGIKGEIMTLFSKHCPQCESENIFREAFGTWNVALQEWQYEGDDLIRCNDCFYNGYAVVDKKVLEEEFNDEQAAIATKGEESYV